MSGSSRIRAFLAVPLSAAMRESYGRIHAECARRFRGLRWVRPENLHVTVRFLGDTDERLVESLRREVDAATGALPAFRLVLGRPGAFGRGSSPRTLWLAIEEGAEEMAALASRVDEAVRRLGLPPDDKPWAAHITLARNPKGQRIEGWEELIASSGLPGLGLDVEGVDLLSSRLLSGGPIYTTVWTARLKKATA